MKIGNKLKTLTHSKLSMRLINTFWVNSHGLDSTQLQLPTLPFTVKEDMWDLSIKVLLLMLTKRTKSTSSSSSMNAVDTSLLEMTSSPLIFIVLVETTGFHSSSKLLMQLKLSFTKKLFISTKQFTPNSGQPIKLLTSNSRMNYMLLNSKIQPIYLLLALTSMDLVFKS